MSIRVHVDPNVEPIRVNGVRWYPISGQWLPSVTSILDWTRVDGPQLARWKAEATPRMLLDSIRARDEGAVRGKVIHAMVERKLLGGEDGAGSWWDSIAPTLERVTAVHGIELPLVHPELRYASRADLWCEFTTKRWILDAVVDWKTARRRKRRAWVSEHVQQVAAYCAALPICYHDRPAPDHGVIVVATEDHRLRCDACGWEATLSHDADCPHCFMPTRTLSVTGHPADEFVFDAREIRIAFDKFADRCAEFHAAHEAPDLPIPQPSTQAARAAE